MKTDIISIIDRACTIRKKAQKLLPAYNILKFISEYCLVRIELPRGCGNSALSRMIYDTYKKRGLKCILSNHKTINKNIKKISDSDIFIIDSCDINKIYMPTMASELDSAAGYNEKFMLIIIG